MRHHFIFGPQPFRNRFIAAHDQFFHRDVGKALALQADQQFAYLIDGGNQAGEKSTWFQSAAHVCEELPRFSYVQHQRICVGLFKAIDDRFLMHLHVRQKRYAF